MPIYPGDPPVDFTAHASLEEDGFRVSRLTLGTHAGTHLDAPAHFLECGQTVDRLGLAALVGPARVIDFTDLPMDPASQGVRLGNVSPGERLLFRTDWDRQFGRPAYYESFPSLDVATVQALAAGPAALIGLETPSLCADHAADEAAHRLLLSAGVLIIEGLTGLSRLPEQVSLIALPLLLTGLDGSPCRVIAAGR